MTVADEGIDIEADKDKMVELTTRLVAAYVRNNAVRAADLPKLIDSVHAAFLAQNEEAAEETSLVPNRPPAVNPKKSVTPDYIICLEDGKKFKSMKMHLRVSYDLTPDQYREKWGLEPSYPMVAPNYATKRSNLAKTLGLGRKAGRGGRTTARDS